MSAESGAIRTRSKGVSPEVGRHGSGLLYAAVMVAVIVGVDVALFRGRPWERLMVNIGIVLLFGAFYLRFLRRP